jgi:hypothetical protein
MKEVILAKEIWTFPPKRGKKYKEVVDRGCGLLYYPYEGDYDCYWEYEWDCDRCPIVIEENKKKGRELI